MQSDHLASRSDMQPDFSLAIDVEKRREHRELGKVEDDRRRRGVLRPDINDKLLAVGCHCREAVVHTLDDEFKLTLFLGSPGELARQRIELGISSARFKQLERDLIERIGIGGPERQLGFAPEKDVERAAESDFGLMVARAKQIATNDRVVVGLCIAQSKAIARSRSELIGAASLAERKRLDLHLDVEPLAIFDGCERQTGDAVQPVHAIEGMQQLDDVGQCAHRIDCINLLDEGIFVASLLRLQIHFWIVEARQFHFENKPGLVMRGGDFRIRGQRAFFVLRNFSCRRPAFVRGPLEVLDLLLELRNVRIAPAVLPGDPAIDEIADEQDGNAPDNDGEQSLARILHFPPPCFVAVDCLAGGDFSAAALAGAVLAAGATGTGSGGWATVTVSSRVQGKSSRLASSPVPLPLTVWRSKRSPSSSSPTRSDLSTCPVNLIVTSAHLVYSCFL